MARLIDLYPPQLGIRVDVGGGKTHACIGAIFDHMPPKEPQAQADNDVEAGCVVISVPTLKLADELAQRIAGEAIERGRTDLRIGVWRGREADDPNVEGRKMCLNLRPVQAAVSAGHNVESSCCATTLTTSQGKRKLYCKHYSKCGYQKQKKFVADIWIVTHAMLFIKRPKAISQPRFLIIDESFLGTSLRGVNVKQKITIPLSDIRSQPVARRRKKDGSISMSISDTADLVAQLVPLREKLAKAIELNGIGPMKSSSLEAADLGRDDCLEAYHLERKRKKLQLILPGMSGAEADALADAVGVHNKSIDLMCVVWSELALGSCAGAWMSGRVCIEGPVDESDASGSVVRLQWAEPLHESWRSGIIHIDATLRLELVSSLLPFLRVVEDLRIETPHQRVIAVTGKSFSDSALKKDGMIREVWQRIRMVACLAAGSTLAIVPKFLEDGILKDYGPLPAHISLAHHGAITGLDAYGNVGLLIVVGRSLPSPNDAALIAGALSGDYVQPLPEGGWYDAEVVTLSDKQGMVVSMVRETHPHPLAEQVRARICDDGLIQAIGRGRGVNRTADNPLRVELWGEAVPPVEVDEFRPFHWLSKDEIALGNGIWVESAADLSALWPELGSEKAIHSAREERTSPFPYIYTHTTKGMSSGREGLAAAALSVVRAAPHLRGAEYRKAGPGTKLKLVVWDARLVPDVRAVLEKKLGTLASLEMLNEV